VPYLEVDEVLRMATEKHRDETQILDDILNQRPTDRAWIDASLEKLGCTVHSP
jgi:hypothetical protein